MNFVYVRFLYITLHETRDVNTNFYEIWITGRLRKFNCHPAFPCYYLRQGGYVFVFGIVCLLAVATRREPDI